MAAMTMHEKSSNGMRQPVILGVPMDLGQQRRGVDMGPSAVRYAGLFERLEKLGLTVRDLGNIAAPGRDEAAVRANRAVELSQGKMRHLAEVVTVCSQIYAQARGLVGANAFPIFLGGDHSIAIGTVSAMSQAHTGLGLIWVDAHGDFNTPQSTPSGNIHGMPVAALTGRGHADLIHLGRPGPKLRPQDIVMIGIRDLDGPERQALAHSGIRVFTMRAVDELGMAQVARQALAHLQHATRIHISLDMDVMDPSEAPGVGTPVPGGMSYREAHLLMEILAESTKICSLDVVEINPILDEQNRTAELAVALIASLLGQRIL